MTEEPTERATDDSTPGDATPDDGVGSAERRTPEATDGRTTTPAGSPISRRSALAVLGLTGLLGLGATGTASADPQGQVGTASDPLVTLHSESVVASEATVTTDDPGATAVSATAAASGVASETTGVEGVAAADADNATSPETIPVGVRGETTGDGITFGVEGSAASPTGRGVAGFATSDGYDHDSFENGAVGVMGVTDRSNDHADLTDAIGVFGSSLADSGRSIGVVGRSESPDGVGVLGNDAHGDGYAVFSNGDSHTDGDQTVTGDSTVSGTVEAGSVEAATVLSEELVASTDDGTSEATAVHGEATDTANENYGVVGETSSSNDSAAGVLGYASASSGISQGVRGVTENGIAVEATNDGQSGFQIGLWANIASDSGDAIQALASDSSGHTSGVFGRSNSPDGAGVRGRGEATTGDAIGVLGETDSPDGYGVYSEDDTRSDGRIEAGDGVVHEQRGEPTTSELDDGDVMIYNSNGSDSHSAGDLVYAINDGGSILTQTIAEKSGAS